MRTFTARVTGRFALLVTATTCVVLIVGGLLLDRQIVAGLDELHGVEANELGGLLGADGNLDRTEVQRRIKYDADSDTALFAIQVSNQTGEVLFRSDNLANTILPLAGRTESHRIVELPLLGAVYVSTFSRGPWLIQIGSALRPAERMLKEYVRLSVPLLAVTAGLSVCIGYAFSRATLRPVRAIEATAKRIRAENLAERIPVGPAKDELSGLSILLNQMFDRLQGSFEEIRRFSADVSHELKTPLSLIRLNAEKLRARLAQQPENSSAAGDILEETLRIQQVIDRLLFLAKADSGALAPRRERFDAAAWVNSVAADAEVLAEDRGVRFAVGQKSAGSVRGDADLLRQVLFNLFNNAAAVSRPDGSITLDSVIADGSWRLTVTDEGPGMTPEQLSRAFDRFVRFPNAQIPRHAAPSGHGLGLAICKSIVELHQGTIVAENRSNASGLRVTISLPIDSDPDA